MAKHIKTEDDLSGEVIKQSSTASQSALSPLHPRPSEDDWHIDILIIGVGVEGCAAIHANPAKELLSDRKHARIHYIGVDTDTRILEDCMVEQNILIPDCALTAPHELSAFLKSIPAADMAFIIVGGNNANDEILSTALALYLRPTTYIVMGMVIVPTDCERDLSDSFTSFVAATHTTHIISQEKAYESMGKVFKCIIDTICVKGLICIDIADIYTLFTPASVNLGKR